MALTTVALMFGGRSPEHEVSFQSAKNIFQAIDTEKYKVILIGLSKEGTFHEIPSQDFMQLNTLPGDTDYPALWLNVGIDDAKLVRQTDYSFLPPIDVVFPIIHGSFGEDGTLQGLLRQMGMAFVGPDVCSAAITMDKDVAKRLLLQADLLTAKYLCFKAHKKASIDPIGVFNQLGSPVFVKPARMGSSIGVNKVDEPRDLQAALSEAFLYDTKVIVEEAINGRELECAVMGNEIIATTHVGEVKMEGGFYDYDAKYLSRDTAKVEIPAQDIDDQLLAKLILVAKNAYMALECEGMARVDMFLLEDGSVYVNEVNTLPGFTDISMYPKLWKHAGTEYTELIDQLLQLALEKSQRENQLTRSKV